MFDGVGLLHAEQAPRDRRAYCQKLCGQDLESDWTGELAELQSETTGLKLCSAVCWCARGPLWVLTMDTCEVSKGSGPLAHGDAEAAERRDQIYTMLIESSPNELGMAVVILQRRKEIARMLDVAAASEAAKEAVSVRGDGAGRVLGSEASAF